MVSVSERAGGGVLIIERVVALAQVPMFAGVPDHVLAQVASSVEEVAVGAHTIIVEEGADEDWMYVLVTGAAEIHTGTGRVVPLAPGAAIGEFAALDEAPRSATVTTIEPSLLFRVGRDALREVMLDQPALVGNIVRMLVQRLRAANVDG